MDEGKPTKAKWWSRPRPDAGGAADDGDWHLPAPASAPVDGAGDPALGGSAPGGADPAPHVEPGPPAAPMGADGGPVQLAQPADRADVADAVPDAYRQPPVAEAPRPLHDPDPYSTPPYGEPGPWAPAPPVQHPATTPARGTSTVGMSTAPGTHPGEAVGAQPGPYPGEPGPAPIQPHPGGGAHAGETIGAQPGPYPAGPGPAPLQSHPGGASAQPQPGPYPGEPGPVPQQPYPGDPAPAPLPAQQPCPGSGQGPAQPGPYPAAAQQPPYPAATQHPPYPPDPDAAASGGGPWQRYDPWAAPVAAAEPRGGRPKRAVALGAVLLALVAGVVGGAIGSYLERNGGAEVELPQAGAESSHRAPDSVAGIAASALPGVVTIHTKGSSEQGTGTGFVLDTRGHILTNNHVVEPAGSNGRISVTFAGGQSADADVVGHDSGYDLAVLKVSGVRGLKPLALGNSENVRVGDPVVAIGAPFDLANTVTSGIISAKDRPITAGGEKGDGTDVSYVDALQTDAPINPGNSGGPLVDTKARVIGINSAIRSADSGSEVEGGQSGSIGLGFAIPVNQAKRVAEELINTGKATHPVIGVTLDMAYAGDGARVGTKGNDGGSAVSPGGPGARAGIEPRDVITKVDGVRVHSGEELIVKIRAHRPKDELDITLERNGKQQEVTLVLGSADGN
ncbi:trypsin-like peptidase domain-containing protein [Streptomyces sp. NPDC006552]|uniref:S1C family serine protease n=1 Tax=Streptomyces sp. NPDC006552 TaxID=3157179 RepID=UPI0033B40D39